MSHSDHVVEVPEDFEVILRSKNDLIAGIQHKQKHIICLQFHPEVEHTQSGREILDHFFHGWQAYQKTGLTQK